ncbi:hypothetical protein [Streptomyces sp. NPDC058280]|uniref:hypothetical protein n=1 Tax=Streptomyces sp. NPDC058280 TaxID=3346419 RepID=UPI0036EB3BC3
MASEIITVAASLGGVALGLVGAVIAARIQARGAHAQAEATLRSALDAARLQRATTLDQQARDARRAVYAHFLAAAHTSRKHIRLLLDGTATEEALRSIEDELDSALAMIELEGPDELGNDAIETQRLVGCLCHSLVYQRDLLGGLNIFEFPMESGLSESQADILWEASESLGELQDARDPIHHDWRDILIRTFNRENRSTTRSSFANRIFRRPSTRRPASPSEESIEAFDRAAMASQANLAEAVRIGALNEGQAKRVLTYAGTHGNFKSGGLPSPFERNLDGLDAAINGFRRHARSVLHGDELASRSAL